MVGRLRIICCPMRSQGAMADTTARPLGWKAVESLLSRTGLVFQGTIGGSRLRQVKTQTVSSLTEAVGGKDGLKLSAGFDCARRSKFHQSIEFIANWTFRSVLDIVRPHVTLSPLL